MKSRYNEYKKIIIYIMSDKNKKTNDTKSKPIDKQIVNPIFVNYCKDLLSQNYILN